MNQLFKDCMEKLVKHIGLECSTDAAMMLKLEDSTGYSDAMIYRWRQGRSLPDVDTMYRMIRLGSQYGLHREWAKKFMRATRYPVDSQQFETLLNELFGPPPMARHIPENLPPPSFQEFIGRYDMVEKLLSQLSPQVGINPVVVTGVGGVGKTALVLYVARWCLQASQGIIPAGKLPTFDAFIFVSAKEFRLFPHGFVPERAVTRSLSEILHTIRRLLEVPDILVGTLEEQQAKTIQLLSQWRTLLIIDNMETLLPSEREAILGFLYQLPPCVKVIITSRERFIYSPFQLSRLTPEETEKLIKYQMFEHQLELGAGEIKTYQTITGGIPAAIIYVVGLRAWGYPLDLVLARLKDAEDDFARFFFKAAVDVIRNTPAYDLLLASALFAKAPERKAAIDVAGVDQVDADQGLLHLAHLSLVQERDNCLWMLDLTREYVLAELDKDGERSKAMRDRWVKWYLMFVEQYGGKDWNNFQVHYDRIENEWANLNAVFDWCVAHEKFEEMIRFWCEDSGLEDFANVYGYWTDRLFWTKWLIAAAERRGAWDIVATLLSAYSWLLILRGDPESLRESSEILERAWSLQAYASVFVQLDIRLHWAIHHWRLKSFETSLAYLDQTALMIQSSPETATTLEVRRIEVSLWFYRGLVAYDQQRYLQSRDYFLRALNIGEAIHWQRVGTTIGNWLADICIATGDLKEAAAIIQKNIAISKRLRDQRRLYFYQRSYAYYYIALEDKKSAVQWAELALEGFQQLEMYPEIQELLELLRTWKE